MKNALLLMFLFTLTSCGKWYAEWQGEVRKIEAQKEGEAILLKAENEKKAAIEESRAKLESAKMLAQAEVERAKGVAEANRIIGDSLKGNESYLRYRWIEGLQTNQMQVIYVPTEANLPLLESQRLNQSNK